MTTQVKFRSSRFGTVEVDESAVIEFPAGLIGLPGTRSTLVDAGPGSPFRWLHSLDDADLALPVTNPWRSSRTTPSSSRTPTPSAPAAMIPRPWRCG